MLKFLLLYLIEPELMRFGHLQSYCWLTVVLFSLLTYSGVGSALTSRMRTPPEQRFVWLFAVLAIVTVGYLVFLRPLFSMFLGSPFAVRVAIATVILVKQMPAGSDPRS